MSSVVKTPYKYRYTLGSDAERTPDGKRVVYHRGERMEIEPSSVEFWGDLSNPEPMTRAEFDEVTKGTKGIIEVYGTFADDVKDNKYYTPKIEEFHVGFEYEIKATFGDGTVKTQQEYDDAEWQKQIYSLRSFPYVDRTMTGENSITIPPAIRVKYLDKEDIESFGFEYKGTRDYHTCNGIEESGWTKLLSDGSYCDIKCFLTKDGKINHALYISTTDIYCPETHTPWDAYCEGGSGPGCWEIKIKNKSELKRLLIQLGINE